jgi:dTMP kinase
MRSGSLIAIEGLDGAGLTTQANRLVEYFNANAHRAIYTSQPSEGPVGQLLRRLLAGDPEVAHPGATRMLSLLFAADRVDHRHSVVDPALASGTTVVSDRWYHSSYAYQRTGLDRDWIRTLNVHTRAPDLTIYLQVRPEIAIQRRAAAGRPKEYFHDLATQREVELGYRATIEELKQDAERLEVIDGELSEDEVFAAVLAVLDAPERRSVPRITAQLKPQ